MPVHKAKIVYLRSYAVNPCFPTLETATGFVRNGYAFVRNLFGFRAFVLFFRFSLFARNYPYNKVFFQV